MSSKTSAGKITYTTLTAENAETFHHAFDEALEETEKRFESSFPNLIGETEKETKEKIEDRSPADTRLLLGRFSKGTADDVTDAVLAAKSAFRTWRSMDFRERISLLLRAAEIINERKYRLAAIMSHEAGKSRMESRGRASL